MRSVSVSRFLNLRSNNQFIQFVIIYLHSLFSQNSCAPTVCARGGLCAHKTAKSHVFKFNSSFILTKDREMQPNLVIFTFEMAETIREDQNHQQLISFQLIDWSLQASSLRLMNNWNKWRRFIEQNLNPLLTLFSWWSFVGEMIKGSVNCDIVEGNASLASSRRLWWSSFHDVFDPHVWSSEIC